MAKSDWTRPDIVEPWVETIGDENAPFGDDWRASLVNPLVLTAAVNLQRGLDGSNRRDGLSFLERVPVWTGLHHLAGARDAVDVGRRMTAVLGELSDSRVLDGLRIVDIGCGEGYLGRMLAPLGATYVGLDGSEPLLDEGRRRAARYPDLAPRITLAQAELDGPRLGAKVIAPHLHDGANLLLASAVFDHLENPSGLLEAISDALSAVRFTSAALVIALNPAYHLPKDSSSDPARGVTGEGIPTNATIASTGGVVSCHLRSDRDHLCLFRRSWLRVIHSAPLGFWHVPLPPIESPSDRGIPPFMAYLVAGRPPRAPRREAMEVLDALLRNEPVNLLAAIPDEQKKETRTHGKHVDLAAFEPEEVILERANLGGDLYVVVEGGAHLELPEGADQLFAPGDLLGDLETGPDGRVGSYLYRVRAGADGARVIRIEAALVDRLLRRRPWLTSGLFEQLRDRLAVNLWSFNHYDRPGREIRLLAGEETSFKGQRRGADARVELERAYSELGLPVGNDTVRVVPKQLDITSRLILQGAEFERLDGRRDVRGRIAFLSLDIFKQRSPRASKGSSEEQEALKHLVLYGWVDAFPGSVVRESFPDTHREIWSSIVAEASSTLLEPVFAVHSGVSRTTWNSIRQMASAGGAALVSQALDQMMFVTDRQTGRLSWTRQTTALREEIERALDHPEWRAAVQDWLRFLCRVNCFWYARSPSLFIARDACALRTLALGSNQEVSRLVVARSRIIRARRYERLFKKNGAPRDWSAITSSLADDEPGRLGLYLREAARFFLDDLAHRDGQMLFSGEPDGYPVPASDSAL